VSIAVWKCFAGDLQLHEARKSQFTSLHDCFIRQLKDGARLVDPDPEVLVSPCDAIVGACGRIERSRLVQAKGFAYTLDELVGDAGLAAPYRAGSYATLRLTASMYHRFHAPFDCDVAGVYYIPGDLWNVNPITLRRVSRVFCRNERAVIPTTLRGSSESVVLVAVGAILVGSIRLHCLDAPLNPRSGGPSHVRCCASFNKGDEMGYFRHGSTIVVLATPGLRLIPDVGEGVRLRMGQPLLRTTPEPCASVAPVALGPR
jgi:phosphatidylserine decarboxylase